MMKFGKRMHYFIIASFNYGNSVDEVCFNLIDIDRSVKNESMHLIKIIFSALRFLFQSHWTILWVDSREESKSFFFPLKSDIPRSGFSMIQHDEAVVSTLQQQFEIQKNDLFSCRGHEEDCAVYSTFPHFHFLEFKLMEKRKYAL